VEQFSDCNHVKNASRLNFAENPTNVTETCP
jgi:hypothetical protein